MFCLHDMNVCVQADVVVYRYYMYSNVTALAYFGVELFVASCIFPVATLVFYLAYHVISNTLDTFTQVLYM